MHIALHSTHAILTNHHYFFEKYTYHVDKTFLRRIGCGKGESLLLDDMKVATDFSFRIKLGVKECAFKNHIFSKFKFSLEMILFWRNAFKKERFLKVIMSRCMDSCILKKV